MRRCSRRRSSHRLNSACNATLIIDTLKDTFREARAALAESLALAQVLGDMNRELTALNNLGLVALVQENVAEAEVLFTEVHTRATAVGNRKQAAEGLVNLSMVADLRQDHKAARSNLQQALALAREMGAQHSIALGLVNLAYVDIKLGQLAAARAGLREGLALALRLGALPYIMVGAVSNFAELALAEGQTEWALALCGLARRQPAWSNDDQRLMDETLARWALDPSVVEAGLANGAELDWDTTIQELLKG